MKKKFLCVLLTVIALFSCVAMTVSAEVANTPSVMTELAALKIDGKSFSENDYPKNLDDTGCYVIAVVESGFVNFSYSPEYNLFIYIYNPCGDLLQDEDMNSIQIGLNEKCESYSFFGFKILSRSKDNRFLKIKLTSSIRFGYVDVCYRNQADNDRRVYNIAAVRFVFGSDIRVTQISTAFIFTGFDHNKTLSCSSREFGSLDVKLYATNWISPNAGSKIDGTDSTIYDHYEINTVYFKVPKNYWYQYEYLKSIRASYDAVHLTPIILTREGDIDFASDKGQLTKWAIEKGIVIEEGGELNIYDLVWKIMYYQYAGGLVGPALSQWNVYSENAFVRAFATANNVIGTVWDCLAYYFASLPSNFSYTEGKIAKGVVSSQELEDYFYERYNDSNYDNSKLYDEYKFYQEIDYYATNYDSDALYNMKTFSSALSDTSKLNQWVKKFTTENDSYLYSDFNTSVNYIDVVKDPRQYALLSDSDYETVANQFFIGVNDVEEFSGVCQEAVNEDCYVVLLRFAISDYRCQVVNDYWESMLSEGPIVGLVVDKWAFRNISLAHLVFFNDGEDYVVPVVSDVKDSFGDLDAAGDPSTNGPSDVMDKIFDGVQSFLENRLQKSKDTLKRIFMIVLVVSVILLALWLFFKLKPVKVKYKKPRRGRRNQ